MSQCKVTYVATKFTVFLIGLRLFKHFVNIQILKINFAFLIIPIILEWN